MIQALTVAEHDFGRAAGPRGVCQSSQTVVPFKLAATDKWRRSADWRFMSNI
ncbi:MAG: hypothetical protein WBW81_13130 [Methylocella sp.]